MQGGAAAGRPALPPSNMQASQVLYICKPSRCGNFQTLAKLPRYYLTVENGNQPSHFTDVNQLIKLGKVLYKCKPPHFTNVNRSTWNTPQRPQTRTAEHQPRAKIGADGSRPASEPQTRAKIGADGSRPARSAGRNVRAALFAAKLGAGGLEVAPTSRGAGGRWLGCRRSRLLRAGLGGGGAGLLVAIVNNLPPHYTTDTYMQEVTIYDELVKRYP